MPEHDVTNLLSAWKEGDESALEQLMPLIVDDLRRQAEVYLRWERPGHTLQATALVNEVYMRLVDQKEIEWKDRAHFFAVAAISARHSPSRPLNSATPSPGPRRRTFRR